MICKYGHKLTGKNVHRYVQKRDGRVILSCRTCRAASSKRWHDKHPTYNAEYYAARLAADPNYWRNANARRNRRVS